MNERINQVTIVGGGSAGWIMGLVLTTLLNRADKDRIKITVIESPRPIKKLVSALKLKRQ